MSVKIRRRRTIKLRCESTMPGYDQSIHEIYLMGEDDKAWHGRPISNPMCPILTYPKFAWRRDER